MKRSLIIALAIFTIISITVPASLTFAKTKKSVVGATPTVEQLEQKYVDAATGKDKVRILVMPGHEPDFGGAVYQGVYEREITVEVANQLADYLNHNPRFDVIVARSNTSWNEDLADYFDDEADEIEDFVKDNKKDFAREVRRGNVEQRSAEEQVAHAAAPTESALRLYGINKWANENDVDLVVHLHINDAPDHGSDNPSAYSGYTVYVPDSQYGNADTSEPVAQAIAARLSSLNATSTLAIENKGVVEDQELIALGAYDTLSVPSVLVEYAYITEPKFTHPEVRATVTKDYAYETYLGIQDFFNDSVVAKYPTASLPFTFTASSTGAVGSSSPETYALQAALHTLGFYPTYASTTPANARIAPITLTMCPIDGVMGECTSNAIEAFQIAKGFKTTGTLGAQTLNALNAQFSAVPVVIDPAPVVTTTGGTCLLPTQSLTVNDTDAKTAGSVSLLQKALSNDATIYPEKLVTGVFGPATLKAVQKFQTTNSIVTAGAPGYGLVGPKTLAAMSVLCK